MSNFALSAMLTLNSNNFVTGMQKAQEITDRMKTSVQTATNTVSSMSESVKQKAAAIGDSFKSGLSVARDAFGAAGLASAGFLKSCIDGAAKGQKANMDLAQTIKSTGGAAGLTAQQVSDMASQFSKATTYGAGTIKTGQNMLLTFTNIGKDVFPGATQAMLDMSTKMGSDLPATAIQLGKALNDPVNGVTALTRVGVTFTQQQKDQIKAMVTAGNTAGAQKLILAELNKEFGGQAAAAAQTYQGRLTQLSNTIGAIKGSIGSSLLPYVQKAAEFFLILAQKIQSVPKPIMDIISKVLAATAVFGTLIGGLGLLQKVLPMIVPHFSILSTLFTKLTGPIGIIISLFAAFSYAYTKNLGGFKTFVDGIFKPIGQAFNSFFSSLKSGQSIGMAFYSSFKNIFGSSFAGPIANVIDAIVYSVKGFLKFLQGDLSGAKNMFYYIFGEDDKKYETSASKIVNVLSTIRDTIKNAFNTVISFVKSNLPAIKGVISSVVDGIKDVLTNVFIPIILTIVKTGMQVLSWIKSNWPQIKTIINSVFTGIKNIWDNVLSPVFKFMLQIIKQVVTWFVQNFTLIRNTASIVFNTLKSLISGALTVIFIVVSTILSSIASFWQAHSETIKAIVSNVWNIIKTVITTVIKVVQDVIKAVMQIINGDWKGAWNSICDAVKTIFSGAIDIIKNILSTIGSVFVDVAKTAVEWGKNIIQGLINGVESMIDAVIGKVKKVAESIEGKIKEVLGIHSPSKVMHGIGQFVVQGLSNGMTSSANLVNNAALKLGKGLPDQFYGWGQDIPDSLADGISNNMDSTTNTVMDMANRMRRLIHFTKPDEGPLKDSDTYGPDMVKGLSDGIKNNVALTTNATTLMATNIRTVILQLIQDSLTYGQQIVTNLGQGVQDSIENLTSIVKTLTDKVTNAFKEGFGIHSPSRVMYSIGNFLMQGLINGMTNNDVQGFIQKQIGSIVNTAGGAVSGNVASWLMMALSATGTDMSWLPGLERLVQAESGGDPTEVNNVPVGSEYATGLLQCLPSTFREFAQSGMNDIMNPIHNAAAAIRYIKARYGSVYNTPLFRGGTYAGYALGTSYATPGYHWVGENGPELIRMNGGEKVTDNRNSKKLKGDIHIDKLADTVIVREEADIDKIAAAFVKKLILAGDNM